MNNNWILKNGPTTIPLSVDSFPFAYRTAFNMVRMAREAGKGAPELIRDLTITGPVNPRGERPSWSYALATQKAKENGVLTPDNQINSREFKVKR